MKDFNLMSEIMEPRSKHREFSSRCRVNNDFLKRTQITQKIAQVIDKQDLTKLKRLLQNKGNCQSNEEAA